MTDLPPMWKDMTPEEKGALLLAYHELRKIECHTPNGWLPAVPNWAENSRYRVKPDPVRETVTLYGAQETGRMIWTYEGYPEDTHVLTYEAEDGEPVDGTFKVRRIGE